jgi:putative nucleotidyltransferase with HDIG domain
MPRRVLLYIAAVTLLAGLSALAVYSLQPIVALTHINVAFGLACFAIIAELLEYQLPSEAGGSIATIPFVALGLAAPNWSGVIAAGMATAIAQLARKKHPAKLVFNTAQGTLAIAVALLAYRAVYPASPEPHVTLTLHNVLATALFILIFLLVNTAAVSGVIALTQRTNPVEIWKANTLGTFAYAVFVAPFAFALTWAYLGYGPLGAALLAIPLLGVRQLYITTLQYQKTNRELLELMVKAIEARDPYTSGHSRRVADAATVIARAIGLRPKQVERVRIAALLHDIGKIHSDFAEILQKEGKLSDVEWATMKTHPDKGAELVATLSDLQDIVAPVRHHHEHWNGRGYPAGLSGESIPLASRIITFADTIDALMTDRPYRRGKTASEVREELLRCSGSQFDPSICAKVLSPELWSQLFADRPPSGSHLTLVRQSGRFGRKRAAS